MDDCCRDHDQYECVSSDWKEPKKVPTLKEPKKVPTLEAERKNNEGYCAGGVCTR